MKRKLLILALLIGITALSAPPPALAGNCRWVPYCSYLCPTAAPEQTCCCSRADGQGYLTTCEEWAWAPTCPGP